MTDRRDAVARALEDYHKNEDAIDASVYEDGVLSLSVDWDGLAGAALAAIAATEPTEAEIEAAAEAAWNVIVPEPECSWQEVNRSPNEWEPTLTNQRRSMRAALIAARTTARAPDPSAAERDLIAAIDAVLNSARVRPQNQSMNVCTVDPHAIESLIAARKASQP